MCSFRPATSRWTGNGLFHRAPIDNPTRSRSALPFGGASRRGGSRPDKGVFNDVQERRKTWTTDIGWQWTPGEPLRICVWWISAREASPWPRSRPRPHNPALAVIHGIEKLVREGRITAEAVQFLLHGTTVATNALLEHKGRPHRPSHHRGVRGHPSDRPAEPARSLRFLGTPARPHRAQAPLLRRPRAYPLHRRGLRSPGHGQGRGDGPRHPGEGNPVHRRQPAPLLCEPRP